jgi:hypothetical protein
MESIYDEFIYQGWSYVPWEDRDVDNSKIWHDFVNVDGRKTTCNWSPYDYMRRQEIQLWIDLRMPKHIDCVPLRYSDLLKIQKSQS